MSAVKDRARGRLAADSASFRLLLRRGKAQGHFEVACVGTLVEQIFKHCGINASQVERRRHFLGAAARARQRLVEVVILICVSHD